MAKVSKAISEEQAKIAERNDISADKTVRELAALAFSDITAVVEWSNGRIRIKDSAMIPKGVRAAIQSVTARETEYGPQVMIMTSSGRSSFLENALECLQIPLPPQAMIQI